MSDFRIVWPHLAIPGALAVVCKDDQVARLLQLEQARERRLFVVQALLEDHIPLAGTLNEVMSRPFGTGIALSEKPLAIYLHHGGRHATYFDLSGSGTDLEHVGVEVEAGLPLAAFPVARTAVNQLLDSMTRSIWVPLVIARLDLYLYGEESALASQLFLPFAIDVSIGPLGGFHQHPAFRELESLAREAICSPSPYYRFLCAYRMYDGVNELRRWLREVCEELKVSDPLPKDLRVDPRLLEAIGLNGSALANVKTVSDLHGALADMRNQIAHFFLKREEVRFALHPSEGHAVVAFSTAGAAMLHYAFATLRELSGFFRAKLNPRLSIGSVLPMKEHRDQYRLHTHE